MEIWATDKLLPYHAYVRNQPPRFGPRMIEERWPELLTAKKLFPLRASLHFDNAEPDWRSGTFPLRGQIDHAGKNQRRKVVSTPGWLHRDSAPAILDETTRYCE